MSPSVIIVGAGLSGLSSALHLLDLEAVSADSVTIVEARKRVGGRLQAHEGVDVGGAWCWKSSHHEVPALAARFAIPAFDQHDSGLNVMDYGDSIARTREALDSAKVRFSGGAAAIATSLGNYLRHKGVSLHFECTVRRISMADDHGVRVEALKAGQEVSWVGNAVFVAIPPRLASPPVMTWEPNPPPELLQAAAATPTWMAQTSKVLITYAHPFWRELGMSGNAMSFGGGPIQQLYDSCGPDDSQGPYALCGFIFGNDRSILPPDDVLRLQVLKQLERMFGSNAKAPLSFSSHRWGDQPLTSGNGGAAGGGHHSMGHPALRVPFGHRTSTGGPPRVWLSAAETDMRHAGLMEGALLSGRRVVEQAIGEGVFGNGRS